MMYYLISILYLTLSTYMHALICMYLKIFTISNDPITLIFTYYGLYNLEMDIIIVWIIYLDTNF